MAIPGFYWLIDGVLAGCSRPGGRRGADRGTAAGAAAGARSPAGDGLDEDLAWLRRQGIGAVLSLTETPLAGDRLARHGLAGLHLAVPDLQAPTPGQLDEALAFVDAQRAQGRAVVVHCLVGQGRTGTVLAAYLIRGGLSVAAALRLVRAVCPGAVGAAVQERALETFAAARAWLG